MSKSQQNIIFTSKSGMNLDTNPKFIEPGDVTYALNIRTGGGESGNNEVAENVRGNTKVSVSLPLGSNKVIGETQDLENKAIIYFICNSNSNHCILRYNTISNTVTNIQYSNPALNFSEAHLINHAEVLDGQLFWTESFEKDFTVDDDYNPPRAINLEKALTHTYTAQEMKLIKKGGTLPLQPVYSTDSNIDVNNLRGKLWQFSYRYIYDDNQKSVFAPYSEIAIPNGEQGLTGYWVDNVDLNVISFTYDVPYDDVKAVEFLARDTNLGNFWIFHREERSLPDSFAGSVTFKNTESKIVLSDDEQLKNYDAVPRMVSTLEVLEKNRVVLGNFVDGEDNVDIDVTSGLQYTKREISTTTLTGIVDTSGTYTASDFSYYIFSSIRFYKLDFTGQDINSGEIIKITLTPKCSSISPVIINHTVSPEASSDVDVLHTELAETIRGISTPNGYNKAPSCAYYGVQPNLFMADESSGVIRFVNEFYGDLGVLEQTYNHNPLTITIEKVEPTSGVKSLKKGSDHVFGIVYYDADLRHGAVNTSEDTKLFVPMDYDGIDRSGLLSTQTYPNNAFWSVDAAFKLNHTPPTWARYYSFVRVPKTTYQSFIQILPSSIGNDATTGGKVIDINTRITGMSTKFPKSNISTYTWAKGDRIRFVYSSDGVGGITLYNNIIDKEIVGLDGAGNLLTEFFDVNATGSLPIANAALNFAVAEIYTPKKSLPADTEPYVEMSEMFSCNFPAVGDVSGNIKNSNAAAVIDKGTLLPVFIGYFEIGDTDKDRVLASLLKIGDTIEIDPGGVTQEATVIGIDKNYIQVDVTTVGATQITIPSFYSQAIVKLDHGDVYVHPRIIDTTLEAYPVESESFSDWYDSDIHDWGRFHLKNDTAKRAWLKSSLIYGGNLIENTKVNNLYSFNALNIIDLPAKYGSINALKEIGFTLKAITDIKNISLYVGRTAPIDAAGSQSLVLNDQVLGTVNIPDVDFGTIHPESVKKYDRSIYFYDQIRGAFIRDSANGMMEISKYGVSSWLKDKSANAYNIRVHTGINKANSEVYFNFMDGTQPIVFNQDYNRFKSFSDLYCERFGSFGDMFVSFVDGEIWINNVGSYNSFFGVDKVSVIEFPSNDLPTQVKVFKSLSLEGNTTSRIETNPLNNWEVSLVEIPSTNPFDKRSIITRELFKYKEDRAYSNFLRNYQDVSNPALTTYEQRLINGEVLRGEYALIRLQCQPDKHIILRRVAVKADTSGYSF